MIPASNFLKKIRYYDIIEVQVGDLKWLKLLLILNIKS